MYNVHERAFCKLFPEKNLNCTSMCNSPCKNYAIFVKLNCSFLCYEANIICNQIGLGFKSVYLLELIRCHSINYYKCHNQHFF